MGVESRSESAGAAGLTVTEERRLVTALFCDLVGFTPMAEEMDPEDVLEIQQIYFPAMKHQIERYGGKVEKYAGDAVLALFGVPVAHEDDAERAVLCGLGMQAAMDEVAREIKDRWEIHPSIRVGVNTGEVVSGSMSGTGWNDVSVSGDAVNTAARLQTEADPGEVLAGQETVWLTRRRIRYGDRRDLALKGKTGTVSAHPALGLRQGIRERWEEGWATPLIGRQRELATLNDLWSRAQQGEGQLVTIVGEPGVGKSRLIAEFVSHATSARRLSADTFSTGDVDVGPEAQTTEEAAQSPSERMQFAPTDLRLVEGRCLSYGQEVSLWLIADLLRSLFVILEEDDLAQIEKRLGTVIPGLMSGEDAETEAEIRDVLGEVLGLPPRESMVARAGAEVRRNALVRSLRKILTALSRRGPTIMVLQDLHWVDASSQDVLRDVVVDLPGLRMLVLVAQREGWTAPWSDLGWPERITLRPLREKDAGVLAGAVLGNVRPSPELERYLAERAGGNPFFVEELLRTLRESGGIEERDRTAHLVADVAQRLPSTLTEVLLARLDRLEARVRMVAQVGSVIGRSFAVRLMAEVVGEEQVALELPLTALQQAEIAFPKGATAGANADVEYSFKHVTMQEAAYNTLVQKRRKSLHLQTARAIAQLYPSDEYAEMIAYHYGKTDEAAEAIPWLEKAGDRAAAVYSNESAADHYQDALKRLERSVSGDGERARILEKLGAALRAAAKYPEAAEVLTAAVDRYTATRNLEAAGRATAMLGRCRKWAGSPREGIESIRAMIDTIGWSAGAPHVMAQLHTVLAELCAWTGQLDENLASAQRAAAFARQTEDDRLQGEAEMRLGTALMMLGRMEDARAAFESAIPKIEKAGDLLALFSARGNYAETFYDTDLLRAVEHLGVALTAAKRAGNPRTVASGLAWLSSLRLFTGYPREARRLAEEAIEIDRDLPGEVSSWPMCSLAEGLFFAGDVDEAKVLLERAISQSEAAEDRQGLSNASLVFAWVALAKHRPADAVQRLEALTETERPQNSTLARAYLALGTEEGLSKARTAVDRALDAVRDRVAWAEYALWAQGLLLSREGRTDQALEVLAEGRAKAHDHPYPWCEAQILIAMAEVESARENRSAARLYLREALEIARRIEAMGDVERIERLLAELDPPAG